SGTRREVPSEVKKTVVFRAQRRKWPTSSSIAAPLLWLACGCGAEALPPAIGDPWRAAQTSAPADPAEPLQWHLFNDGTQAALWPEVVAGADIGARAAWQVTQGDASIVIAVLDHGTPPGHRDLPDQSPWLRFDFVDGDADPSPPGGSSL